MADPQFLNNSLHHPDDPPEHLSRSHRGAKRARQLQTVTGLWPTRRVSPPCHRDGEALGTGEVRNPAPDGRSERKSRRPDPYRARAFPMSPCSRGTGRVSRLIRRRNRPFPDEERPRSPGRPPAPSEECIRPLRRLPHRPQGHLGIVSSASPKHTLHFGPRTSAWLRSMTCFFSPSDRPILWQVAHGLRVRFSVHPLSCLHWPCRPAPAMKRQNQKEMMWSHPALRPIRNHCVSAAT